LDDSPDIAPGEASEENATIVGPGDAQARPGILMRGASRGPPGARLRNALEPIQKVVHRHVVTRFVSGSCPRFLGIPGTV
jgi:hypothetical protein